METNLVGDSTISKKLLKQQDKFQWQSQLQVARCNTFLTTGLVNFIGFPMIQTKDSHENWLAYCNRTASETITKFDMLINETDFEKEALSIGFLKLKKDQGVDIDNHKVFIIYFNEDYPAKFSSIIFTLFGVTNI